MLEALGDIGDFVGGLAVVLTLVYLAIQVGQNTRQLRESARLARLQARDDSFRSFCEFRSKIVGSSDVAEVYLEGLRDPSSLGPVDRLRFNLLADELFRIFETSIHRVSEGSGDVDGAIRDLRVDSILRAPGMAQWWEKNRHEYPADFAALIDSRVAAPEPAARRARHGPAERRDEDDS